ncbi:hypothetical protein ACRQ4B_16600 [Curtobacterium sp. SP.BCo]|uniref:hypothetical protein n=1 Tax=Curtobacterium sp. SP.BCo TaxID=3435229 RepID=UPI003F7418B4
MSAPSNRHSLVIVLVFLVAGIAIGVVAVAALLRDPSDDVAWVAVAAGVLCIAWGLTFRRLDDDSDTSTGRIGLLTTGLAMTLAYVVIRAVGRPVDSAVVGALAWPAWKTVNRLVDGWVRRREARGEAEGPDPAG